MQPVAQAAGKELPSELQAAAPLSSRPGVQAGKQLWSHQQLHGATVPLCQAAPERAVSWAILFFFFSPPLSSISYSPWSTRGCAFVKDYRTARVLKVTPFSLVPPTRPAAERSPRRQPHCLSGGVAHAKHTELDLPPLHFPWREQCCSSTLHMGAASPLMLEPALPACHLCSFILATLALFFAERWGLEQASCNAEIFLAEHVGSFSDHNVGPH